MASTTTKVRTTFTPDRVLEVGDAEFLDLSRQNLLHSHEDKEGYKSPHKWAPATKGQLETAQSGVITDALDNTERTAI